MYYPDQSLIAKYGMKSPDNMYQVYKFVVATANRKFALVPRVLANVKGEKSILLADGTNNTGFSGSDGMAYQVFGLNLMYAGRKQVYKAIRAKQSDPIELMSYLVSLPNISVAKSGFLAQLLTGTVGCFDVHNMRDKNIIALLGAEVNPNILRIDKRTPAKTIYSKLFQYTGICAKLGSAFLWDNWCATLAAQYSPSNMFYPWKTADEVSLFHLDCLGLSR
jgi:hypothetical protein